MVRFMVRLAETPDEIEDKCERYTKIGWEFVSMTHNTRGMYVLLFRKVYDAISV